MHWFQVRAAANALVQEGVYGTRNSHYYYPAPCPDNNGNMILVFSRSGASEFGSIGYTGRRSTDPLGTLQPSALLRAGVAHYQALDSGGAIAGATTMVLPRIPPTRGSSGSTASSPRP